MNKPGLLPERLICPVVNYQSGFPHGSGRSSNNCVSRLALQPMSAYKLTIARGTKVVQLTAIKQLVEWIGKGQRYRTLFGNFATLKPVQTGSSTSAGNMA